MNLQPLYDVKARLEQAAIAGTGLLSEDFRLTRAAESFKPLAAASPVFGRIDAGLSKLLAAPQEQRSGLLLDLLALVDAVAYTQGRTGIEGELVPLPRGNGVYRQISYGQINPLLTALTTTGGGRMEIIQSAWENHPEFFEDYRVLPAVVAGLGDGYGEIADLNAKLLKQLGPAVAPALKEGFDPTGKKEMARRVEVIAAIEGEQATPWLREVLPEAKKDVRTAVITALGGDQANAGMLLDLAKSERGANRDAALEALSKLDGEEVRKFWSIELQTHSTGGQNALRRQRRPGKGQRGLYPVDLRYREKDFSGHAAILAVGRPPYGGHRQAQNRERSSCFRGSPADRHPAGGHAANRSRPPAGLLPDPVRPPA